MTDDHEDEEGGALPAPGAPDSDDWDEGLDYEQSRAKGKALDHSRHLNVHRWSDHPEANEFVDTIYDEFFAGRKKEIRKRHLKVILLDLYLAWSDDPTLLLRLSRNHNDYKAGSIYNELHISRLTPEIVDILIANDFVDEAPGFNDRETGKSRFTRIWPKENLINLFREARFSPFNIANPHNRLPVVLRDKDPGDKKSKNIEYEHTLETIRMSAMLARYTVFGN